MNFLSISRMRAYRSGGRVRLFLKLEYPRLDENLPFSEPFNSFYSSLADEVADAFSNVKMDESLPMPVTVNIGFSDFTKEYIMSHKHMSGGEDRYIVILRKISFSQKSLHTREFTDVYDKLRRVFVK